jgi:hypothetical protein
MPQEDGCCFNCGVANATTRDHVFSRALFPAPKPNLMTVPCCPACQALYYPDEGYFRDLTAGGAYANLHARALWEGPITRSFDRDGTARDALAQGLQRMEYRTPAGLYFGDIFGIEGDRDRVGNVLRKITRGLFYKERGTPMPHDVTWTFEQVSPLNPPLPDVTRDLLRSLPLREVPPVVRYRFGLAPREPRLSVTWFALYERTMFVVGTLPDRSHHLRR